ncbi:MAG: 3-phosphoshikimate 1-carboxyvinyltransferase [Bacteroidetes bacterium]|nr:MAG: 3-phosphoshikimate 1-carboxyvinyltransferase [Bacteroidota bacterium]
MSLITVSRKDQTISGSLLLPSSKSISNRLLIIQALSGTGFEIDNLSMADDTVLMQSLLEKIDQDQSIPDPGSRIPLLRAARSDNDAGLQILDAGNAGTVMRFLTALLAITPGTWLLRGSDRMLQRPIGILVEALRTLGASIEYAGTAGYPPLLITGKTLGGEEVTVDGSVSSQFASALLLISPSLLRDLTIRIEGESVSFPYLEMTVGLMKGFGITVEQLNSTFVVKPGNYRLPEEQIGRIYPGTSRKAGYRVEADWSAAAFWYETAALARHAKITLKGLKQKSLQGDAAVAEIYRQLGVETVYQEGGIVIHRQEKFEIRNSNCEALMNSFEINNPVNKIESIDNHLDLRPLTLDLQHYPDLAPALIVTCSALGIPARLTGLRHLQVKESDRLSALGTELKRLGRFIRIPAPGVVELPAAAPLNRSAPAISSVTIETYGDHRIAMAFAPLAMLTGTIRIANPEVVSKSYPGFWAEMKQLGFEINEQE